MAGAAGRALGPQMVGLLAFLSKTHGVCGPLEKVSQDSRGFDEVPNPGFGSLPIRKPRDQRLRESGVIVSPS